MLDKCGDVIETNVSLLVMALQELKQTTNYNVYGTMYEL